MTLKGKKNHYGVKLLRGYGCSIRLKDKKVILRGGTDIFTGKAETEEWFVSQIPYERVVVCGKGYLSTDAISLLSQKNVNVILLDSFGNLVCNMSTVMTSNTATKYRMGQYDAFRNPEKIRYLQNKLVKDKIGSQVNFLKSVGNGGQDRIDAIAKYLFLVDGTRDKRELLTIESRVGNLYFRTYASLFDEKYGFESRRGGGLVMSNRYAPDVINGLLNYGYSVLASEIARFVHGLGLDPYYGFYHKADTSFQALVYDLIEPFRWLVEYAVYKVASDTNHNHPITRKEYAWTREGRIILDNDLIRRFFETLKRKFQSERLYRFNHGLRRKNGMSMCQEITIVKIYVQHLTDFCGSSK
ncbi:CRISPR-associated endonuclease Cas1 [Candidatus Nitrososphaera sp. FF02]|uniref:CRISPR-associated endonuclease Cas1 n=1 Tax=Candidatus Nitrososphaera sp. FF02 TaxID=3398226 RepID=UPI0039EBE1C6